MHCLHVVGARPNFMKMAPLFHALSKRTSVQQTVVHTGQHYDTNMSDVFFRELGVPTPDVNLQVGPGTQTEQTSLIMVRFEAVLVEQKPDVVIVYGDVNSTLAAALVCAKTLVPVIHVEAGLRSFDRAMPEEINRIVTDHLAHLLFTPSEDGTHNLLQEGIPSNRIAFVGNIMIDSLVRLLPKATDPHFMHEFPPHYALVTLHRPSNVDDKEWLIDMIGVLDDLSRTIPIVFPVHPRTQQHIKQWNLQPRSRHSKLTLLPPVSYLNFLSLERGAAFVVTDSGGIQEETTFLGVPCLTVRETTERPVTVSLGTNILVGRDASRLRQEAYRLLDGQIKRGGIPPLWDGKAAERIADVLTAKGNRGDLYDWLSPAMQTAENAPLLPISSSSPL